MISKTTLTRNGSKVFSFPRVVLPFLTSYAAGLQSGVQGMLQYQVGLLFLIIVCLTDVPSGRKVV